MYDYIYVYDKMESILKCGCIEGTHFKAYEIDSKL